MFPSLFSFYRRLCMSHLNIVGARRRTEICSTVFGLNRTAFPANVAAPVLLTSFTQVALFSPAIASEHHYGKTRCFQP